MANTSEDFDVIDRQRRELEEVDKRLTHVLAKARRLKGDESAAHDKELHDARDLLRLAHRTCDALETDSDEAMARNRAGFQQLMHELVQVLAAAEARLV